MYEFRTEHERQIGCPACREKAKVVPALRGGRRVYGPGGPTCRVCGESFPEYDPDAGRELCDQCDPTSWTCDDYSSLRVRVVAWCQEHGIHDYDPDVLRKYPDRASQAEEPPIDMDADERDIPSPTGSGSGNHGGVEA